jgi:hypothetical protein
MGQRVPDPARRQRGAASPAQLCGRSPPQAGTCLAERCPVAVGVRNPAFPGVNHARNARIMLNAPVPGHANAIASAGL